MAGDGARRIGQVARKLICPDKWTDGYPGPPAYVKELDVLLKFADERGCLARFVPNIEARNTKRDEAINELRLAYLFESLGFPIVAWDPPGLNGKIGEFALNSPEKIQIFTEIKSPGWESELSPAAIKAGRTKEPKYKGLGGGAVGNSSSSCFIRFARSRVRFMDPSIFTKRMAISRPTVSRISAPSVFSIRNLTIQ